MEKVCNVLTVVNGLSTMNVKKAALDTEERLNIEQNLTSHEFGNMLLVYASLKETVDTLWVFKQSPKSSQELSMH